MKSQQTKESIILPASLQARIDREQKQAEAQMRSIEQQYTQRVQLMLEGYVAGLGLEDGVVWNLSDDGKAIIVNY